MPGGLKNNREFVAECVEFAESVPEEYRELLFDPQTSGGLLVAIHADAAHEALHVMERHGVTGRHMGSAVLKKSPLLYVK